MIRETVDRIRVSLKSGKFTNEASVSQGIVLPVLQALDWPVSDTSVVAPEYPVESGRVDYALCDSTGRPKIFLEVKRVGQSDVGDRQLFEYAFLWRSVHGGPHGRPGVEFSTFLEQKDDTKSDACTSSMSLKGRPTNRTNRLQRYLQYQRVTSGDALSAARHDYQDAARNRQIASSMPRAWHELLSNADESLVELLADKGLCCIKIMRDGYPLSVIAFMPRVRPLPNRAFPRKPSD